jgi:hypothetical protein
VPGRTAIPTQLIHPCNDADRRRRRRRGRPCTECRYVCTECISNLAQLGAGRREEGEEILLRTCRMCDYAWPSRTGGKLSQSKSHHTWLSVGGCSGCKVQICRYSTDLPFNPQALPASATFKHTKNPLSPYYTTTSSIPLL